MADALQLIVGVGTRPMGTHTQTPVQAPVPFPNDKPILCSHYSTNQPTYTPPSSSETTPVAMSFAEWMTILVPPAHLPQSPLTNSPLTNEQANNTNAQRIPLSNQDSPQPEYLATPPNRRATAQYCNYMSDGSRTVTVPISVPSSENECCADTGANLLQQVNRILGSHHSLGIEFYVVHKLGADSACRRCGHLGGSSGA